MGFSTSVGLIVRQLKTLSKHKTLEIIALVQKQKKLSISEVSERLNIPFSTARKYLEELVAANLLEKKTENERVVYVGKRFSLNLTPETILQLVEYGRESMTEDLVRAYGSTVVSKMKTLAPLVKAGKLSIYDFAAELGLTYIEAYALLEENGYL